MLTTKNTTPSVVRRIETGAAFSARFFAAILATNPTTAQIKRPQATGATILAHGNSIVLFLRISRFPATLNKLLLEMNTLCDDHILKLRQIFCLPITSSIHCYHYYYYYYYYYFLTYLHFIATSRSK